MNKLYQLINSIFFKIFNLLVFIFFGAPIIIYLSLLDKVELNFFSIFDILLKIVKFYKKFFFSKSKNSLFKIECFNFLKKIKKDKKKVIILFLYGEINDLYIIFLFLNYNFFYFRFLNEKEYSFYMKFFVNKINKIFFNENKNIIFNKEYEVIFYLREESVNHLKMNLNDLNLFYVKKEIFINNKYILLKDNKDNILISYQLN